MSRPHLGVITPARVGVFLHRADNCATVSPSTAQQLNKEVKVGVVAVAKYQHGYSLLVTPCLLLLACYQHHLIIRHKDACDATDQVCPVCRTPAGDGKLLLSYLSLCYSVLPPPGTLTRASI